VANNASAAAGSVRAPAGTNDSTTCSAMPARHQRPPHNSFPSSVDRKPRHQAPSSHHAALCHNVAGANPWSAPACTDQSDCT
jgi:hypothetical protein